MKNNIFYDIPQIFYDIIARIVPGIIILISLFLVCRDHKSIHKIITYFSGFQLNFYNILLLLIISYVLATLLSHFFDLLINILSNLGNCLKKLNKKLHKKDNTSKKGDFLYSFLYKKKKDMIYKSSSNECYLLYEIMRNTDRLLLPDQTPAYYTVHDFLRIVYPEEARRLMKINAEARASKTFSAGFILIFLIYYFSVDSSIIGLEPLSCLTISYLFYTRANKLEYYFINGTWNILWFHSLGMTNIEH